MHKNESRKQQPSGCSMVQNIQKAINEDWPYKDMKISPFLQKSLEHIQKLDKEENAKK